MPRDPSVTSFPYMTPISAPIDEWTAPNTEDHKPVVKKKAPMTSFRIDSKADVTAYLEGRLKRLQQLAGKKIAKAWIKGICPKKQARFPYQNNKRAAETGEPPRIPGWWPQEDGVCRFIEPDHIRREGMTCIDDPKRYVLILLSRTHAVVSTPASPPSFSRTAQSLERRYHGIQQDSCDVWMDRVPQGACWSRSLR